MNTKRLFSAALAVILCGVLSSCGTGTGTTATTGESTDAQTTAAQVQETAAPSSAESAEILNFVPPQKGEKIAVITVKDYGTIKIKLFPEAAPKAVENFVGLAEMNYYDELIFHRIIPQFMNQGGDPRGNGTGGQSMWGDKFDGGIPEGLYHFSGAVAYANSGSTSTNGSQFYIVNTDIGYIYGGPMDNYDVPQNVKDMYNEKGGTPFLDGGYTVFGQVFEGYDVVQAISKVETDENDKPLKQVMIESIRIVEYEG
ncbi:MAG: peptidylprolyl isomerase [Oscillospiraceae bacterium]|nr:peptidylprolyl isomerase [Oscillospiraceae bacterium]